MIPGNVVEMPELRECLHIFRDRSHAGEMLAEMLDDYRETDAIIFAIPAGGIPVAVAVAERLRFHLEIAVVSKITLPWNTEAGYGAVAFDGTVLLNRELIRYFDLTEEQIRDGQYKTTQKVMRRVRGFRGDKPYPDISHQTVFVIDDGLASGFTVLTALQALQKAGASKLIVAVPTASLSAIERIAPHVEFLYCVNVRGGWRFAVADAYMNWADIDEAESIKIYRRHLECFRTLKD